MKDWMMESVLMTNEQKAKQDKRKENRKRKLAIDAIKGFIVCGNIKKAVDIAEKNGISPEEFGKISAEV